MADEAARHDLRQALAGALGAEQAATPMSTTSLAFAAARL